MTTSSRDVLVSHDTCDEIFPLAVHELGTALLIAFQPMPYFFLVVNPHLGIFFPLDFRESRREEGREKHQCESDRLDGFTPTHFQ